ncbi:hypothetical protein [Streptomyces sp. S1D4-20]|uniref:hypothetical protein n=1 Tax=Streptomyces sp. S1D4-20 TaxID=2594462 RepID=UPI0011623E13|nr:hypothetical protein [Streptomyces sp. S1D4-20]QDN54224.1 hypothetical protein FNV67_01250 [Streptomyces sp. S1D4-20]
MLTGSSLLPLLPLLLVVAIAWAVHARHLRRQIEKEHLDGLTGLPQRHGFDRIAPRYLARGVRHAVFLFVDLDRLKTIPVLLSAIRNAFAFVVGAVVFYADVVAACALGLLCGPIGAKALGLPWALAVMSAAVVWVGMWCILRAVAIRADGWITQPIAGRPGAPVRVTPLVVAPEPATATITPPRLVAPRSTLPRALEPWELADWECWRCGRLAVKGTHAWDDRGPGQFLSNHALECHAGHRWTNSTDGG